MTITSVHVCDADSWKSEEQSSASEECSSPWRCGYLEWRGL